MAQWVRQQGSEALGTNSNRNIYVLFTLSIWFWILRIVFSSTHIKINIFRQFSVGVLWIKMLTLVGTFYLFSSITIITLRLIQNMEAKFSCQMRYFCVFLPDVCQLSSRHIGQFVHATERENSFWPNCSKFAVECDWNSKSSQNVQNWLFWKNRWAFGKKIEFFSKSINVASLL